MILREFYEPDSNAWQDVDADQSKPQWGEARKTKLTLGMINKMRKMKEVQSYERAKDLKKIRIQYQPPAGDSAL